MPTDPSDFFDSKDKRPWSRIKNQILASYMSPYMAKVVKKGYPLLIIDAFAGPGKTQDGQPGSPLIICQAAEKYASGKYRAIFVNNQKKYHEQLKSILEAGGWNATPVLGDAQNMLKSVIPILKTQSVFLYIDPFGMDCEFDTLAPFLKRASTYSTEILINLSAMGIHRLAARHGFNNETSDPEIIARNHNKLTQTLGGDYWKEIMLADNGMDAKMREKLVVDKYREKLSSTGYLTYTGACPVQTSRDGATKYYMVFASPHPDAMVLLNDAMCNAFNGFMIKEETKDTLFSDLPWTAWRDTNELTELVIQYITKYPRNSRANLWVYIVTDHFMRFTHSEYIKAVDIAIKSGKIFCSTPIGSPIRKTKRLNHDCVLEPMESS